MLAMHVMYTSTTLENRIAKSVVKKRRHHWNGLLVLNGIFCSRANKIPFVMEQ